MNIPTLWADFNDVYGKARVSTTLLNTPGVVLVPEAHDVVVLQDDDGSHCWATVVSRKEDHVVCQLHLDTWRDPSPKPRFNAWGFHGIYFQPTTDMDPQKPVTLNKSVKADVA